MRRAAAGIALTVMMLIGVAAPASAATSISCVKGRPFYTNGILHCGYTGGPNVTYNPASNDMRYR